jgi:hypothetical protein
VVALVLLAAAIVLVQRHRRQRSSPMVVSTSATTGVNEPLRSEAPVTPPRQVVERDTSEVPVIVGDDLAAPPSASTPLVFNVMGRIEIKGLRQAGERRIVEELLVYLACHDRHHMRADQIQLGLWPVDGSHAEVGRKTFHNYLSMARQSAGAEHLPDASASGGYLLIGFESDWATFGRLTSQADAGRADANALRAEALRLVRGQPFEGVPADAYDWVTEEHLDSTITRAIAVCAQRLANDLLEAGDPAGAERAARSGILGAPDDFGVWLVGALALKAQEDRTGLARWLRDASRHLDPADSERINSELGHHEGSDS